MVGTGINTLAHCSVEAKAHIEQAEQLIVHVPDPLGLAWLKELHPDLIDLQPLYRSSNDRADAYERMIATICDAVTAGRRTVAVFYGHPGVFVYPSHEAIRRLRQQGFAARMLPGISAEDCLFADLGVDPGRLGCYQIEATDFLFRNYLIEPRVGLILWQVGVAGDFTLQSLKPHKVALSVLAEKLGRSYPAEHMVVLYEAATLAIGVPRVQWLPLFELGAAIVSPITTLYIPPTGELQADDETLKKMGLTPQQVFVSAC